MITEKMGLPKAKKDWISDAPRLTAVAMAEPRTARDFMSSSNPAQSAEKPAA